MLRGYLKYACPMPGATAKPCGKDPGTSRHSKFGHKSRQAQPVTLVSVADPAVQRDFTSNAQAYKYLGLGQREFENMRADNACVNGWQLQLDGGTGATVSFTDQGTQPPNKGTQPPPKRPRRPRTASTSTTPAAARKVCTRVFSLFLSHASTHACPCARKETHTCVRVGACGHQLSEIVRVETRGLSPTNQGASVCMHAYMCTSCCTSRRFPISLRRGGSWSTYARNQRPSSSAVRI